jgi:hypothetical protein
VAEGAGGHRSGLEHESAIDELIRAQARILRAQAAALEQGRTERMLLLLGQLAVGALAPLALIALSFVALLAAGPLASSALAGAAVAWARRRPRD